jgi:hypothetical protein
VPLRSIEIAGDFFPEFPPEFRWNHRDLYFSEILAFPVFFKTLKLFQISISDICLQQGKLKKS